MQDNSQMGRLGTGILAQQIMHIQHRHNCKQSDQELIMIKIA
ncbi:unnamed protein product [Paramecium octaurelia]|uniref:Uncharacterized protein n=1 Tax=Paramecium octaurelia TaxID=43137 RepID=A0A8S1WCJ1_PAROT|nr:unnamed protein product [Paramecium octaurelia]